MVSSNDISEAKRRVREMQEKARSYNRQSPETENPTGESSNNENESSKSSAFGLFDIFSDLSGGDDSSKGLILALILILSREKADNMLILALLYILL